jgi:hypothetical protein
MKGQILGSGMETIPNEPEALRGGNQSGSGQWLGCGGLEGTVPLGLLCERVAEIGLKGLSASVGLPTYAPAPAQS